MSNRLLLLSSIATAIVACNVSQDLGNDTSPDAGGTTSSGASGSSSSSGASGSSTSSGGSSGTSGGSSGTSGGVDGGGGDANGGDGGSAPPPCPTQPGYEPGPHASFRVTAGYFAGTYDTSTLPAGPRSVIANGGHWSLGLPHQTDYDGHQIYNVIRPSQLVGGQEVGPSWVLSLLSEETSNELTVGVAYPVKLSFLGPTNGPANGPYDNHHINPQSVGEDIKYRYPGDGPGACTLTLEKILSVGTSPNQRSCKYARFSCTGLVGKGSGVPFDVVDGRMSMAF